MYNQIADIYLEIFPLNQEFLAFIPEYLGKPGAKVLDLGCGPGDYVDALSNSGYQATGIDGSFAMIEKAKVEKRGSFYHYSFSEIAQLESGFDCVYCVGNSLSYLSNNAWLQFLRDVQNLLKNSGFFVFQVVNWDRIRMTRKSGFPINSISGGRTFHRRYEWIDDSEVIFHTELQKDNEILDFWAAPLYPKYCNLVVSDLQVAGLTIVSKFGNYLKSPYDLQTSPATIMVARKN